MDIKAQRIQEIKNEALEKGKYYEDGMTLMRSLTQPYNWVIRHYTKLTDTFDNEYYKTLEEAVCDMVELLYRDKGTT